jgi:preprotein translocase SecE subunit
MMTTVALGVLFLGTAAWAWKSLEAIRPPTPTWDVAVESMTAGTALTVKVGDRATLVDGRGSPPEQVGVATVTAVEPREVGRAVVTIGEIELSTRADGKSAEILTATLLNVSGAAPMQIEQAVGVPAFQIVFVQAAVATVIVLVGGFLTYFYVGRHQNAVEFLIATDGEMRKVNWSTKKIVLDSTYVVIAAAILIAGFIFAWDIVISNLFRFIDVMRA